MYDCDKNLPFHECELALLRNAVDKAEDIKGYAIANSYEIKKIVSVVEEFIKSNRLICYGGTAINNILPEEEQFYDKKKEIPDYDFFSPNALKHAKDLANIYSSFGYDEVEAKAGQHFGTYKVFVNFIPIADITQIHSVLYTQLKKSSIEVENILYTPPNMLRMSMYLELSRPAGDISRWEKVLKRLTLLNKNYPIEIKECKYHFFTRNMESRRDSQGLFDMVCDFFIAKGVVFFGGWASSILSNYMNKNVRKQIKKYPDFDVLSENASETTELLKIMLKSNGINNVTSSKHKNLDEIIPEHYEIKVGKDTIAFIYQTIACYSYNLVDVNDKKAKIATIDTMLSLYLSFIYSSRKYYDSNRILCMANFLFKIQQKNRLKQNGPLRRFTINCYGTQATKESMRAAKSAKYEELKTKRNSHEYELWFLNYKPKGATKKTIKRRIIRKKSYKKRRMVKKSRSKANMKVSMRANINKLLKPLLND
jgi:hypothetical protein